MHLLLKIAEQVNVDSQTNATATATLAAPGVGFKWRVIGWRASYSGFALSKQVNVDSQSNLVATATLAAPGVGVRWRVTGWRASYSGLAITAGFRSTVTGLDGGTIGRGVISSDAWEVDLSTPLDGADNGAVSVALPAGGVGAVGDVSIHAYRVSASLTDGFRSTITGLEGVTIGRSVSTSDAWEVNLTGPIDGADNTTVAISLPAGGVGVVGDVSIQAFRVPITLTDG